MTRASHNRMVQKYYKPAKGGKRGIRVNDPHISEGPHLAWWDRRKYEEDRR